MTNEEKASEIIQASNANQVYDIVDFNALHEAQREDLLEIAEWKDEQLQEAKSLLRECYNTILGITALDCPEDIAKARSTHDSSLIKRIESFMYNNQ